MTPRTRKLVWSIFVTCALAVLVIATPLIPLMWSFLDGPNVMPMEYDYWNCDSDFDTEFQYCNVEQNNGMPFCYGPSFGSTDSLRCTDLSFFFESDAVGVLTISPKISLLPLNYVAKSITLNGFSVRRSDQEVLMIIGDNITNITALGDYAAEQFKVDLSVFHKTSLSIHVLSPGSTMKSSTLINILYITIEYSPGGMFLVALIPGCMVIGLALALFLVVTIAVKLWTRRQYQEIPLIIN